MLVSFKTADVIAGESKGSGRTQSPGQVNNDNLSDNHFFRCEVKGLFTCNLKFDLTIDGNAVARGGASITLYKKKPGGDTKFSDLTAVTPGWGGICIQ